MAAPVDKKNDIIEVYRATERKVDGGKKSDAGVMLGLLPGFFAHYANFSVKDDRIILRGTVKDISHLRGMRDHVRVDLQGREGNNAARIAFQIGDAVNAQVVIPLNKKISRKQFENALIDSYMKKKVMTFLEEERKVEKAEKKSHFRAPKIKS